MIGNCCQTLQQIVALFPRPGFKPFRNRYFTHYDSSSDPNSPTIWREENQRRWLRKQIYFRFAYKSEDMAQTDGEFTLTADLRLNPRTMKVEIVSFNATNNFDRDGFVWMAGGPAAVISGSYLNFFGGAGSPPINPNTSIEGTDVLAWPNENGGAYTFVATPGYGFVNFNLGDFVAGEPLPTNPYNYAALPDGTGSHTDGFTHFEMSLTSSETSIDNTVYAWTIAPETEFVQVEYRVTLSEEYTHLAWFDDIVKLGEELRWQDGHPISGDFVMLTTGSSSETGLDGIANGQAALTGWRHDSYQASDSLDTSALDALRVDFNTNFGNPPACKLDCFYDVNRAAGNAAHFYERWYLAIPEQISVSIRQDMFDTTYYPAGPDNDEGPALQFVGWLGSTPAAYGRAVTRLRFGGCLEETVRSFGAVVASGELTPGANNSQPPFPADVVQPCLSVLVSTDVLPAMNQLGGEPSQAYSGGVAYMLYRNRLCVNGSCAKP